MYTFDSHVRYSETDQSGALTINALVNYLQDCSAFQSESLGIGIGSLRERNRAWLVSSWQILIDRLPAFGEKITIGTQAISFEAGLGHRNFMIQDASDKFCVKASSYWIYIDTESGRPLRPDSIEVERYGTHEPLEMEYAPRKLTLPKEKEIKPGIPVQLHHLDSNHHMNNAQYVSLAYELLPEGLCVEEIRVEYRKQAFLGDLLIPGISVKDDWYYVGFYDENGKLYASIAMRQRKE